MAHHKAELVRRNYEEYKQRVDAGEEFPTVISDMIADLLHLGDALAEENPEYLPVDGISDWDPEVAIDIARDNYEEEVRLKAAGMEYEA